MFESSLEPSYQSEAFLPLWNNLFHTAMKPDEMMFVTFDVSIQVFTDDIETC